MSRLRLAPGWWILLAVVLVAAFIASVDLNDRRRSTRALADSTISQLFAGEGGWALLTHPRQVSSWRVAGPPGQAVLPDRQSVSELVDLLHQPASYAHGVAVGRRAYDVAVRFEDELGSMTLLFTRAGTALEVLRDGSPLGQADTTPVAEQLRVCLRQVLGEPVDTPAGARGLPPAGGAAQPPR